MTEYSEGLSLLIIFIKFLYIVLCPFSLKKLNFLTLIPFPLIWVSERKSLMKIVSLPYLISIFSCTPRNEFPLSDAVIFKIEPLRYRTEMAHDSESFGFEIKLTSRGMLSIQKFAKSNQCTQFPVIRVPWFFHKYQWFELMLTSFIEQVITTILFCTCCFTYLL